ncbi:MAG TPA: biotin--[acetyl-CoA-carboxylase] ligase [Pseudonocardiaceae bacterium]|nr:biotin--[acetyl-CoA-carboxylase] ligase [Pseudonocardiaceae bacterium]
MTTTGAPLDQATLRARLLAPNGPYAALDVVERTGSTNTDLAFAARHDAADRTVLIAEQQTAGQGRRSRQWTSPPGGGLYLSVLLRPGDVPPVRLSWLTLLAGVALVRVANWAGATGAGLKWPNDLLLGPEARKAAGVLAEVSDQRGNAVVLGMGINVLPLPEDVPLGAGGLAATSFAEAGARQLDRTELAVRLLTELATLDDAWRAADGNPFASGLHEEYRQHCVTFGSRVRVELGGISADIEGVASYLEGDGTLVVRTDDGTDHSVSAGDVVHLRTED